ncbi:hypothetical protein C8T65DRAFT_741317 [Cerioporus squamosus]|nr:hypothetical protein C8T65DRAFT_741317 [Cerioporus squamosus]
MSYTWLLTDAPNAVPRNCWLFSTDVDRFGDHSPEGDGRTDRRSDRTSLQSATIQGMDTVYAPPPFPTSSIVTAALEQTESRTGSRSNFVPHTPIQRTFSVVSSWVRDLDDPFNAWASPRDAASVSHEFHGDVPPASGAPMPPVAVNTPSSVTTAIERVSSPSQEPAATYGARLYGGSSVTQADLLTSRSSRLGEHMSSDAGNVHPSADTFVPISLHAQSGRDCDRHFDLQGRDAPAVPRHIVDM